jgi:hypothetical protein
VVDGPNAPRRDRGAVKKLPDHEAEKLSGTNGAVHSNKADVNKPHLQTTFFGPNYAKLTRIKAKYDQHLFTVAEQPVGRVGPLYCLVWFKLFSRIVSLINIVLSLHKYAMLLFCPSDFPPHSVELGGTCFSHDFGITCEQAMILAQLIQLTTHHVQVIPRQRQCCSTDNNQWRPIQYLSLEKAPAGPPLSLKITFPSIRQLDQYITIGLGLPYRTRIENASYFNIIFPAE